MAEYIREVEKVIDKYHKLSSVFLLNRKTALFYALTVFEDACRIGGAINLILSQDRLDHSFLIREQQDSLNVFIQWIFQDCPNNDDPSKEKIIPERYIAASSLLKDQASPYSAICSAYISYSRGYFTANVNEKEKRIIFADNPDNRGIVISDMMEPVLGDQSFSDQFTPSYELISAGRELISSIRIQDDCISYSMDDAIWIPHHKMMERQWICTSELPLDWKFDTFSVRDFKNFWVAIATLCLIHMTACQKSGIQGGAVNEAVLVKSFAQFTQIVAEKTDIPTDRITAILKLLTYNCNLKNNDIIYQPFVELESDLLALAPHLILSSRPERNLISLISKIKDKSYFDLTNQREEIMQGELDTITEGIQNILVSKNQKLPGTLPDVDYAIWDMTSNTILICELKWLVEADSTPEVFNRIQDLEHGCSQVSDILAYADEHCLEFCSKVFGIAKPDKAPKIYGCVVSKKGARVDKLMIPVISLHALREILKNRSVFEAFEAIQKREYLISAPDNFEFGLQKIKYAGYTFEIPALIKENPDADIQGTYKRVGPKIDRNDPCPCGSGKKFKKCCGK